MTNTETAEKRCGICCEPATHMVAHEGWDGPACERHALHAQDCGATITPLATLTLVAPVAPVTTWDRTEAIAAIRTALRERSGRAWSVTGGTGTVWGWITIHATPARRDRFGGMSDSDRAELSGLLGVEVHHQGQSIPASSDYRAEYVARARGERPTVTGTPYWD